MKRKMIDFDNESIGSTSTDAVSLFDEYMFDEESTNESFLSKKSRKAVQQGRLPTARANVDDAMALQTETNTLLRKTISQNDTIIELLADLVRNSASHWYFNEKNEQFLIYGFLLVARNHNY